MNNKTEEQMEIDDIVGFRENEYCSEIVIMDRFGIFGSDKSDRKQISQMQNLGYIIFYESFGRRIWIKLK